jgi:hypothetical protein
MTWEMGGYERARAWVLVKAAEPSQAARQIHELDSERSVNDVVVRADIVEIDGYDHNIVVPIDAENEDTLLHLVSRIENEVAGLEDMTIAWVREHVPYPTHVANGWIDESEVAMQIEQGISIEAAIKPGRQGESPGLNAWG